MSSRAKRYRRDHAVVINFRIQPRPGSARRGRRPLRANAERRAGRRFRRALVDLATPTPAIMAAMTGAIDRLAGIARPSGTKWWNDPGQFDGAAKLAAAAFAMLRPPGPRPKIFVSHAAGDEMSALRAALREIQAADGSVGFEKQTARQRQLVRLKADLGPLIDRALAAEPGTPSDLHSFSSHSKPN